MADLRVLWCIWSSYCVCIILCPSGGSSQCQDLPLGDNVLLEAECQPGASPSVTYRVQDPAVFHDDLAVVTVQFTCTDSPDTETIISQAIDYTRTATVPRVPPAGTQCTFFGCYVGILSYPGFQIPPVSCSIDVDECSNGMDSCDTNADCVNTEGSYQCHCRAGYKGNGTHCTNVDECATGLHDCGENMDCLDSEGSYSCTCAPGYARNGDNCTNVDECATGLHDCGESMDCLDSEGSYSCTCMTGFARNGVNCTNIDECSLGTHNCSRDTVCEDTIGGYSCQSVSPPSGSGVSSSIGEMECPTRCSRHATCNRSEHGYQCVCNDGFVGNGRGCKRLHANLTH